MRIPDFLIASTYLGFIVLFAFVGARAIRDRGRANRDAVLFFGVLAMVSVVGLIEGPLRVGAVGPIQDIRRIIGLTIPLLLLRLLDGFSRYRWA